MECNVCGYKCVPQWLNDEAHCLKCQAVLKRRPSVHEKNGTLATLGRAPLRPITPPTPTRQRSKSLSSVGMIGPERFFYDKSTWGSYGQGRGIDDSPNSNGTKHTSVLASDQTRASDTGDDRARMECSVCGFKCVPQWLNDEAHCLKCQAVLKRRPSVHQKAATNRSAQRRASTPAKMSDKISSRKLVGPERFFYDRTTYTGTHTRGGPC